MNNTDICEGSNLQKIGPTRCLHHCRHFGCPSLKPAAIVSTCTAENTLCLRVVLKQKITSKQEALSFRAVEKFRASALSVVVQY